MKLGITQLAIFLTLGAVFNIAIAWGCAAWVTSSSDQFADVPFDSDQIHLAGLKVDRILLEDLGWSLPPEGQLKDWDNLYVTSSTGFGLEYQDVNITRISGCFVFLDIIANKSSSGWPCLALEGIRLNHSQSSAMPHYINHWLIETPLQVEKEYWNDQRCLPYHPIWPGFAINTFLYASLGWLLFLCPLRLRRHLRRKRGSCLNCGYDLNHADHKACPECGCKCIDCAK